MRHTSARSPPKPRGRPDAIRRQTEAIGRYVAEMPAARVFYEAWGTPSTDDS
ncbi:MAG: hypothetical protein WBQ75_05690 [Acetobacteraceae bacterium]